MGSAFGSLKEKIWGEAANAISTNRRKTAQVKTDLTAKRYSRRSYSSQGYGVTRQNSQIGGGAYGKRTKLG